ncbi:hypothetical protein Heshes_04730 [Alicyclobacillus hesperidum]|uniref:Uncharacterized protein n=1 Tax=Alicyclobacillus hesperidum TaxID=89784 RepID=A0AA37X6E7_9BACL|nr:hypothetical protein [Alicyclobacillus hesperidum]GLV12789.1 hypothetical protein Heshes_04730 [Alicyclobacillus hesperidum]
MNRGAARDISTADAFYHYTSKQAFIWPYDEQARLIGEHLYVDMTSAKVERLNTDDVVTTDWVQQTAKALLRTL